MNWIRSNHRLAVAVLALCAALTAAAQNKVHIGKPSNLDKQYMAQQRASLADLAAINLGRQFNGNKNNDLELLQRLLDRGVIRPNQIRELQAMGVIMGDLLAEDLGMHWVIYEDAKGRSRALRYQDSDNFLFPITMISRRREADNRTPVAEIYQKAHDIITPLQQPLPFQ